MIHVAIFWTLLIASCVYAFVGGGKSERVAALIIIAGAAASAVVLSPIASRYEHMEVATALVDLAMLIAFLALTLTTTRYWPSWMTALQLLQVLAHPIALFPSILVMAYGIIISVIAYPVVILLAVGTLRHRLRQQKLTGTV